MPEWLRGIVSKLPTARYNDIRHRMSVTQAFSTKIVNEKMDQIQKGALISNDSIGLMSKHMARFLPSGILCANLNVVLTLVKANMNETGKSKLSKQEIIEQVRCVPLFATSLSLLVYLQGLTVMLTQHAHTSWPCVSHASSHSVGVLTES